MPKWKYKVVNLIRVIEKSSSENGLLGKWLRAEDLQEALNDLGAEGWELVNIQFDKKEDIIVGFFKRAY